MIKNLAGQTVSASLNQDTNAGPAHTGLARVQISQDGAALVPAAAPPIDLGDGFYTYAPTQAETNAVHIMFAFDGAAGIGARPNDVSIYTIDQALAPVLGYANAEIYIDTVIGNPGAVVGVNGTVENPVDNLGDALTLSAALNIDEFHVDNNSTLVLDAAVTDKNFNGFGWNLNLNGQIITSSTFTGMFVSGTATGSGITFRNGSIQAVTIPPALMFGCSIFGPIIANFAGDFTLINCHSEVAGLNAAVFNFGALIGDTSLQCTEWSGTLQVEEQGATGTDVVEMGGTGIFVEGTCTGGLVNLHGNFTVSGITNLTLVDDARYSRGTQVDATWDEVLDSVDHIIAGSAGLRLREASETAIRRGLAQGSGVGVNQIQFDVGASAVDGIYDPGQVVIIDGTGDGQTRGILEYDGTSKIATVDRNWKVVPDVTSEFIIFADRMREHVNEGLAQAGTSTTITLNTSASVFDGAYEGQLVFLRSGQGDDQARIITAYVGATKVVTVHKPWDVTPDTTTGYVILANVQDPNQEVEISQNSADKVWLTASRTLTSFSTALAVSVWNVLKANVILLNTMGLLSRTEDTVSEDLRITATCSGTHSLTTLESDIVVSADDQYKGRVIIFAKDTTTVELQGQGADITGGGTANNTLIFTALTTAPVDGDVFTML